MARRLQTWYAALVIDGPQRRVMVAAPSRKEAARLMGTTDRWLRDYGSETGNAEMIALATSKPGTLFATETMNYPHEYKEIPPLVEKWKSNLSMTLAHAKRQMPSGTLAVIGKVIYLDGYPPVISGTHLSVISKSFSLSYLLRVAKHN